MIFVTMFRSRTGGPTAFIGISVDRVRNIEPGRFHVSLSPAEFDLVRYGGVGGGVSLDIKLFDEERTVAEQTRTVIHEIRIRERLETKAGDVRKVGLGPNAHNAAGLEIASAEQREILLLLELRRELMPDRKSTRLNSSH